MRFAFAMAGVVAACSPSQGDPTLPDNNPSRVFDADCPKPGEAKGAATWPAIYNDLIGPKSVGRCQDPACHGGAAEQGGLRMKNTQQEAYDGMKDFGILTPLKPDDAGPPPDPPVQVAGILRVLVPLPSTGVPRMPRELCGNRYLTPAEIQRIKDWGAKGADP